MVESDIIYMNGKNVIKKLNFDPINESRSYIIKNDKLFLCVCYNQIHGFNLDTKLICIKLVGHEALITSMSLGSNSMEVWSSSQDMTIKLWSVETQSCLKSFNVEYHIDNLIFLDNQNFLATIKNSNNNYTLDKLSLCDSSSKNDLTRISTIFIKDNDYYKKIDYKNNILLLYDGKNVLGFKNISKSFIKIFSLKSHSTVSCVTISQDCKSIAYGTKIGYIIIWREIICGQPLKLKFHWHSEICRDIFFSCSDLFLYSIGLEGVLVCWDILKGSKTTLPRLGMYATSFAHGINSAAIVHDNNEITFIDLVRFKLTSKIIQYTRANSYRSGLNYDMYSDCIVFNGVPGTLLFFSTDRSSIVYAMDVCNQNYISEKNSRQLDVTHLSFIEYTDWLITVEHSFSDSFKTLDYDPLASVSYLKFWIFDKTQQIFVLFSTVDSPHNSPIVAIDVLNLFKHNKIYLVTLSYDSAFKIWLMKTKNNPSINDSNTAHSYDKNYNWICVSCGSYKHDLPPRDVKFSLCNSSFTCAYDDRLTVWSIKRPLLKKEIIISFKDSKLRKIVTGKNSSNYNFTFFIRENDVSMIDCLNGQEKWNSLMSLTDCQSDNHSSYFIAIGNWNSFTNCILVLSSNSPIPLQLITAVSNSILSNIWLVPSKHVNNSPLLFKNMCFISTVNKDILALNYENILLSDKKFAPSNNNQNVNVSTNNGIVDDTYLKTVNLMKANIHPNNAPSYLIENYIVNDFEKIFNCNNGYSIAPPYKLAYDYFNSITKEDVNNLSNKSSIESSKSLNDVIDPSNHLISNILILNESFSLNLNSKNDYNSNILLPSDLIDFDISDLFKTE